MHSIRSDECKMLRLTAEKLQVKRPYIYSNLYYNKTPYNFCKSRLFLHFFFCYKIKYANLGLFIWLFYFDIVHTLLQFIENLNLNSLLVKRQIDNPSPGAVTGGN